MIYPCPVNFWEIRRFPLTWTIIFINIFIYIAFFSNSKDSETWLKFFSDENMTLTGRIYHQYVQDATAEQREKMPIWVQTISPQESIHYQALGAWALRDSKFLDNARNLEPQGDEVAIKKWKSDIYTFKSSYFSQMVFRLGLSHVSRNTLSWVTYQFSHSGLVHLLSNMAYLLLFGAAVEAMIGAAGVIIVYICGGVVAGMFFLFMKTHGGAIPMVGASGSISALMAFYILFEQRRRVRFAFFVTMLPKHYGYIYLPAIWMVPMYLISDFSHHLSYMEGLGGGVAYTAHIGGTVFGAVTALLCRYAFHMENGLLRSEFFPIEEPLPATEATWDGD